MGQCRFKTSELKRCVAHALRSTEWSMGWGEQIPQPALFFVHDSGVYLMSNGKPRDMSDETRSYCAYAKGCRPGIDNDAYETARRLVGGDDFAETLVIDAAWMDHCERYDELIIKVTRGKLEVYFSKPKKVQAVS